MKKVLFLAFVCSALLFNTNVSAQCSTLPDECSNACELGSLPLPAPCTASGGVSEGNPLTLNLTNIGATASFNGSLCAFPAADVWYRFTATGTQLVLNITGGITNPNVSIYQGNNCNTLAAITCVTGSGGSLNQTFSPLTPGTVYYLQISGSDLFDQGNFTMTLQNNLECDNCLLGQSFTPSPAPSNGTYQRGQTVNFCYTVTDYNKTALNWIHGIVLSFGPGWDTTTLTPVSVPPSCAVIPGARWGFYTRDSSHASNLVWGPGFYYETTSGSLSGIIDNDPGNNYGDAGVGTNCPVTFCWRITTRTDAPDGADLEVKVKTTGDSQSGSWTSPGCETDPIASIKARIAACDPPAVTSINAACGLNNGMAIATGAGVGPWDYVWTNASGTTISNHQNIQGPDTLFNLAPGQYFVSVLDSNNCSQVGIANIGGSVDSFTIQATNVTCFGAANGTLTITAVNQQSAPFTYSLNGGVFQSSNVFGSLSTGNYTVVTQNRFGCFDTLQTSITQPTQIIITDSLIVPASCLVGGIISINASGGTGNLSFSWSGALTGDSISNLAGGLYIVTITDQNGCTLVDSFTVISPLDAITFNAPVIINDSCNGSSNGSITISTSGGTGTIKYKWNTPNQDSTATVTNLPAGTYSVTATDALSCTASTSYTITEPAPVTAVNPAITPVTCQQTGSISITGSGGTPNYTYRWSNNATTSTITNLTAGPYSVTITDQNGCTGSATFTVTDVPSNFVLSTPVINNVTCNNQNNGSITATTTGGKNPVRYRWSTSVSDTTATVTNLAGGNYSVTATDSLGCTASATYTIINPPAITLGNASVRPAACNQGGSIAVQAFGGTGVLTYSWSNNGSGDSIGGLSGGVYSVTVRDQNGCSATAQYNVSAPGGIVTLNPPVIVNLLCNGGNTGSITASSTGGVPPVTYSWSNNQTTPAISNLTAGAYSLTVTDSVGCSASATYQVTQPAAINIASTVTPAGCTSGGSIRLTVTGGTGTKTYTWSNVGSVVDSIVNLAAGTYSVTVRDQNNCSASASFTVNVSQGGISLGNPVVTNVRCFGENNGSISITATGGNGAKNYVWSSGETTATIQNKAPGTYTLTVTDQGSCSATATYVISEPAVLNPNLTYVKAICFFDNATPVSAAPTGGTPGYTYLWNNSSTASSITSTGGVFSVTVTDSRGCTATFTDSLRKNPQIYSTRIYEFFLCADPPYGNAKFVGQGGTGPLTYTVVGSSTNSTGLFPNLSPGTYSFIITDSLGCTETGEFEIPEGGNNITFDVDVTPASCAGKADGTITITPSASQVGFFQYTIPGVGSQTNNVFTNVPGGEYTINISNIVSGCNYTATASVPQPAPNAIDVTPAFIDTVPGAVNTITVTSDFEDPSYTWSPAGYVCVSANCDAITAAVDSNTVFYVKAFNADDSTCYVIDSVVIIVRPEVLPDSLVMPTGFTPNGDNNNALYGPVFSENFATPTITAFRIYNRWGQAVHNATNYWDGRFNGAEQPAGTYVYYIEVQYPTDNPDKPKIVKKQGTVTLLR